MLILHITAPFATFRNFTAGSFRPTAPFMTYSAAYGLLLNLAGIEMRRDDGRSPMTLIGGDLPTASIALGMVRQPEVHTLFQQLHNYPVGSSGKEREAAAHGNKYNVTPARRGFLSGLDAYLALRDGPALAEQVLRGLAGEGEGRYGLPFLGDNNFLPDRIEPVTAPEPCHWLIPVDEGGALDGEAALPFRLTLTIDRADMAHTRSGLFQPIAERSTEIPDNAWQRISYV